MNPYKTSPVRHKDGSLLSTGRITAFIGVDRVNGGAEITKAMKQEKLEGKSIAERHQRRRRTDYNVSEGVGERKRDKKVRRTILEKRNSHW